MTATWPPRLSELDERRWGFRTALASATTPEDAEQALAYCEQQGARLLVVRCPADRPDTVHALEEAGARLMDTLVHYTCDLERRSIPEDVGSTLVRPVADGDVERVREIAAAAFAGYSGHYHADPALPDDACDAAYAEWATSSCLDRAVADEVLVSEAAGRVVGFATLRLNDDDEGEGVLFAVAPEAQGLGIYRSFMLNGMAWCRERGRRRMIVSTQTTNVAVQKVWVRVGFEPLRASYTLHWWAC